MGVVAAALAAESGCSKYAQMDLKKPAHGVLQSVTPIETDLKPERWDLALIADPQLHNYFGGPIKSMSPFVSRLLTRVARRPAVLNLLGDVVLDTFVSELAKLMAPRSDSGTGRDGPPPDSFVLLLGDAANVSCTNEFDRFIEVMDRRAEAWLAVHGNHDSFMAGNLSSYQRAGDWPDEWVSDDSILLRETRWSPGEAAKFAYPDRKRFGRKTSWAQACADPKNRSAPMTKGVWTRRYLMALERQTVQLRMSSDMKKEGTIDVRATPGPGGSSGFHVGTCRSFRFDGKPADGSALGHRSYRVSGVWRPRATVEGKVWTEDATKRCGNEIPPTVAEAQEWNGFVVQSFQADPETTVILIDTSLRGGPVSPMDSNSPEGFPGMKAVLGEEQLEHVREHVQNAEGRKIVFAGHHPWKDFQPGERSALLEHSPLMYLSGHTHFESSFVRHGQEGSWLPELNIASVTDWPMEAALLSFDPGRVLWRIVGLHDRGEGNRGCAAATNARFYEPLVPKVATASCTDKFDARDHRRPLRWREHQMVRSEGALQWLGSRWDPPFAFPAVAAARRVRADVVNDVIETNLLTPLRVQTEHHVQWRNQALVFAVCASRAVADGGRSPIEQTCATRTDLVTPAAAYSGFNYR